jgi:hypothetical protein
MGKESVSFRSLSTEGDQKSGYELVVGSDGKVQVTDLNNECKKYAGVYAAKGGALVFHFPESEFTFPRLNAFWTSSGLLLVPATDESGFARRSAYGKDDDQSKSKQWILKAEQ